MVVTLSIRLKGDRETFLKLSRISKKADESSIKFSRELALEIESLAKRFVSPLKTGTGALKESIKAIETRSGRGWFVVAGRGLSRPYAYYQEKGFAPHWIHKNMVEPNARMRFNPKGFAFVRRHSPFMRPAFTEVVNRLDTLTQKYALEILNA